MYYPYLKSNTLLSPSERNFYRELKSLLEPRGLTVFSKVRLADLVWIPDSYRYFNLFFSRIKSRHIDFVVCDSNTFDIKLLIELDDQTHNKPQTRSRDRFKDKVIQHARLPFIRCSTPLHVCNVIQD